MAFKSVALGVNVPPAGVDQLPPVAPPPTEAPRATVVPPWQIAAIAGPIFTVGFGFTVIVFDAEADPQEPPDVVSARVAVPEYPAGGVHVAFKSLAFGLKVPPASVDHVPPVALPPIEPPRAAVVPPWQIAAIAGPGLAEGNKFTVTVTVVEIAEGHMPLVTTAR